MMSLVIMLAISTGLLLMMCLHFATLAKYYKDAYEETKYLMFDYQDRLVREKQVHNKLRNSTKQV